MAAPRAFIFDLDGTLIDTREDLTSAVNYIRGRFGLSRVSSSEVMRHTGLGLRYLVEQTVIRNLPDADLDATLGGFRVHYRRHMLERTHPYSGVPDALKQLTRAGVSLGVASNKPVRLAREILDGLGLINSFAAVIGPENVDNGNKPSARLFLAAAEALGARPKDCLAVSDTDLDLKAARSAKMRTCGVTWGFGEEKDLVSARPDLVVRSPAEWVGLLKGSNGRRVLKKPATRSTTARKPAKKTRKPAKKTRKPAKKTRKPAKKAKNKTAKSTTRRSAAKRSRPARHK